MTEESDFCLEMAEEGMQNCVNHLEKEFQKIRAGKASPSMLDSVKVDNYGVMAPLNQVANINTPDARLIVVQPWDKSMLEKIEKAILNGNLGFNPMNDGVVIRISVPPLTEERRKELVRKVKAEGESGKVAVRNIRRTANDEAKTLEKEGIPEDEAKRLIEKIQELTNKFTEKIDELVEKKEKDIMTV